MVILDIKDYIDQANRQFNDNNNYEQLDFNPTELRTEKIQSKIINLKNENLPTVKTANSLLKEKIKTLEFHLLPKIHKANNPRRSVISFIDCYTSRISEFADYDLRTEVKRHVSDDFYLVSLDVRSL